ncbi:unnamed protein product [Prunus armeniaca]|uniref:beta-ketoacyl-[acyl-carrier-protein] synthase I n=1 Tax=Prunus armeniaca TaxID=36596 RepID=A0A6J5V4K4_PRUAR|nr:unnamed protein product [Prunus armeniaca]
MAVISTQIQSHLALRFIESHHILEYESVINVSSETGAGVILCIEKALAQSGVSRGDFNYINAHATSTPFRDLKEYNALIHCFGQNTPETKYNLVAGLFMKSEKFNFDKDFGGMERLDMFFPFDPCLPKKRVTENLGHPALFGKYKSSNDEKGKKGKFDWREGGTEGEDIGGLCKA